MINKYIFLYSILGFSSSTATFSSDLAYISIAYHIIITPLDSLRVDVTSHLQALWCTTSLSVLPNL